MAFMNFFNDQKQKLTESVSRFKNKNFLDAVLAGCAMVSVADGTISKDEKTKMLAFVSKSELLKAFDTGTIVTRFSYFTDMFEFDFNTGRLECMKAIVKIKSNVEEAKLVVTVCCAIGASDGDFDEKEKMVVRDICAELGINPSDLQL